MLMARSGWKYRQLISGMLCERGSGGLKAGIKLGCNRLRDASIALVRNRKRIPMAETKMRSDTDGDITGLLGAFGKAFRTPKRA
jgi:hypothetical protein